MDRSAGIDRVLLTVGVEENGGDGFEEVVCPACGRIYAVRQGEVREP
jgi:hypothetical protein